MATYKQVGYGSQGSDVKELQKLLNDNGYKLSVDGIFGSQTQKAVRDYQQKNKLAVDGIVGTNTWGALTKAAIKPTETSGTATSGNNSWSYDPFKVSSATAKADKNRQNVASKKPGDFTYKDYEASDAVKQAEALLQQQLAQKPGAYQSQWQSQLNDIISKIQNREKFSYDLNGDALYQQYKDQYMLQGQQAMMDTMGQAAALTGGYGNSYAQSVGQQAYHGYLQQLNDRVPELYQLALDKYQMEGDDLINQYGLMADQENQDYGRYRDTVSDYYTELDRLTNDARYQSETDYNRYMDAYNQAYGEHRDSVDDWQQELARADENYFNLYDRDYSQYADNRDFSYGQYIDDRNYQYQVGRDKVADDQWQKQYGGSSGSSGSSGSGGGGGKSYTANPGWDREKIEAFQSAHGLTVDGIWGPKTAAEYDKDPNWEGGPKPGQTPTVSTYYDQLLGAVSTAKGSYSKQDYQTRQKNYQESVAAINDAYKQGKITAEQRATLLRIATPSSR